MIKRHQIIILHVTCRKNLLHSDQDANEVWESRVEVDGRRKMVKSTEKGKLDETPYGTIIRKHEGRGP